MTDLNSIAREQVAHAYAHAPAIRHIMQDANVTPDDIASVDDLAKIPVTSKDKLQEMQTNDPPFGGFLGIPKSDLKRIYISPGPIFDPEGPEDKAPQESAREAFSESGFTAEDVVVNTFLYHMVPAGLLMDAALGDLGATIVPMGPGNTEIQIKVIMELGVTVYCGVPSFLEMIYSKAQEVGIPQLPLKKAFFSAEPYTPSQRQKFEEELGLSTTQAYATADLGIIGYEKPGKQGLYVPSNLIVQICSPESGEVLPPGELGEVVVTTANRTYPLIRFGTGDLSIMDIVTEDGKEWRKLRGWMGRSGEAIKVRGMFLHPNALQTALQAFDNIEQFQAVVSREGSRDIVDLQVVLSGGSVDEDAVKEAAKAYARLSINTVTSVNEIEGSRTIKDVRKFD